tara:strand:+ start:774 stop:953 length:180 start_codon:yes stop_codon:yes gene_type:complete
MGQCITLNVGNSGSVSHEEGGGGGGTNVSVGGGEEEEEEEEDEGCPAGCLKLLGCVICL